jgi:acyl-CoA hydrolase
MEWMTDVAILSGLRLSRSPLKLEGIESIYFRGPSHVGERVSLRSSVNRTFSGNRFEVGVRVEGYTVGGETRHINSAFFTFQLEDQSIALPQLLLETQVEKERAANATARHYLWLDRMAIQFEERQVSLSSENAYELILKTVSQLLTNYSLSKWDTVATQPFSIRKHQTDATLVVRVSSSVAGVTAAQAFSKLLNYSNRTAWDFMCKHIRVVRDITPDNHLIHLAMKSPQPDKLPKDFVLLVSERPRMEYEGYQLNVVAYRSVLYEDIPELDSYDRSHVISSGYILRDCPPDDEGESEDQMSCEVTYIHQVGSSVMPFMAGEFLGTSDLIQKLFSSLCNYLSQST